MLSAISWLYGKIINRRNSQYQKGVFRSHSLGAPTISVGNITVGGSGKTPLVIHIAQLLAEKGESVCVISRGYKRDNERERILVSDGASMLNDAKKAGDEPIEIGMRLLGKAVVIADADRVAAGKWAFKKFGITVFILDDAFQHLKVNRDLDVVVIDATNPFGNRQTLPTGILREPLENLERADLVVITRANLVKIGKIEDLQADIKQFNPRCEILVAKNKASGTTALQDFYCVAANAIDTTSKLSRRSALAFCALGNPANFFDQLVSENFNLSETKAFRDHHYYNQRDAEQIEAKAFEKQCDILLTTAKDAVKLNNIDFKLPVFVVQSELLFDDEKKLREKIHAVF